MSANKYTFKELLQECKVEIPVLQRDYVQGNRNDKKAKTIGEDFASYLVTELRKENPSKILLSFVYGKMINDEIADEVERNRENLELLLDTVAQFAVQNGFQINSEVHRKDMHHNTFIPFDGQQRLTTLFLLHFLVYSYLGKESTFLQNFLYKTRETSRDFLKALLANKNDFKKENWNLDFSVFIEDRPWFYEEWKYDPTVASMNSMLEKFRIEIVKGETEKNIQNIYNNIEAKETLTFDYLDINEKNLDDLLYIKMNASGLDLTDYEKFKSWLIEFVEKNNNFISISVSSWKEKLDTVWYDLFWEQDSENTDRALLGFFKQIFIANQVSRTSLYENPENKEQGEKKQRDDLKKEIFEVLNKDETVSFDFYTKYNLINSENLNFVFNVLDFLTSDSFKKADEAIKDYWNTTFFTQYKYFSEIIVRRFSNTEKESDGRFNLTDRTFAFAVVNYFNIIQEKKIAFDLLQFSNWLRVSRNLIYNSRIDDPSQYFLALQSIADFGEKCLNVLDHIDSDKFIAFFAETQQKEEYLKCSSEFSEWQNDFILAENHHYFYGQIGFIIQISKLNGFPDLNSFRKYYNGLSSIFSEQNLKKQFHISLALLTKSDIWMPYAGSERWSFCLNLRGNARNRYENWRRVFNNSEKKNGIEFLKEFIDENIDNLSIRDIIENRKNGINDWRRIFLEHPAELDYCSQGLIKYNKDGNYIRILGASQINHYHRELRTSVLLNHYLKDYFNLGKDNYKEQRSDNPCYIEMEIDKMVLRIKFDYHKLLFEVYGVEVDNEGNSNELLLTENQVEHLFPELVKQIILMNPYIITERL